MNPTKHVCPGCTLLCDDIEIAKSGTETIATNACEIGQAYYQLDVAAERIHCVAGQPVGLDSAITKAAEVLSASKAPLICGLDQLTTQAQQSAWKLADTLGATIDTTLTNSGRSSMFALQRNGNVSASLGEVANRSDLIVFWFCDPQSSHPRLIERLNAAANHPVGRIIVIDEEKTKTAAVADQFIQIAKSSGPAVIAALQAILSGDKTGEHAPLESTGTTREELETLASKLSSAKYGSIFYGQPNPDSTFDLTTDSLTVLIKKLNDFTRFVGLKLRSDANAQSAENVLAWSTGYPFAVSHSSGYPRYNWLEHAAETTLTRGECDAVLLATGVDMQLTLSDLSRTARDHLGAIPKITLSPIENLPSDIAFQIGVPGISESGEFCRLDDISLPVSSFTANCEPSAKTILDRILELV